MFAAVATETVCGSLYTDRFHKGQVRRTDMFKPRPPGIENPGQVEVDLRFKDEGLRKGFR